MPGKECLDIETGCCESHYLTAIIGGGGGIFSVIKFKLKNNDFIACHQRNTIPNTNTLVKCNQLSARQQ